MQPNTTTDWCSNMGEDPQWHQAAPYTTLSHKYDTRRMSKWFKSSNSRWICSCITSISGRIFNLNISLNVWCAVYFMQFTFHPWVCQINGSFKSPSHYVILFQPGHTTHIQRTYYMMKIWINLNKSLDKISLMLNTVTKRFILRAANYCHWQRETDSNSSKSISLSYQCV